MYECYDNVIGITETDCDCISENRPVDYNVSNSGLYLDELSPISGLVSIAKCDETMWDIITKSIKGAKIQFVSETNALLGKKFTVKRKPVTREVIGEIKSKDIYSNKKNYGVVRIVCSPVRSGFFKLRNIGGVFSADGQVTVALYNNVDGFIENLPTINTIANKHVPVSVNKEYPLYSKYSQPLEYYLVYMFDDNNLPKDTEINCGCGGWEPTFNYSKPYYLGINAVKRAEWANYVMVGGAEINSLTELEDMPSTMKNDMFGLVVELDFKCKVSEVLCDETLDFVGNPLALAMAMAIQYQAAIRVANSVLKSSLLNRENMVARDEWEESALVWQEKYNDLVAYIVAEADHTANDCLSCKDVIKMSRQGLFS